MCDPNVAQLPVASMVHTNNVDTGIAPNVGHGDQIKEIKPGNRMMDISGCVDEVIGKSIRGRYFEQEPNHGRYTFMKPATESTPQVYCYFWDARDGPANHAWWIGPSLGGHLVYSMHPANNSPFPPFDGWRIPHLGPLDWSTKLDIIPEDCDGGSSPKFANTRATAVAHSAIALDHALTAPLMGAQLPTAAAVAHNDGLQGDASDDDPDVKPRKLLTAGLKSLFAKPGSSAAPNAAAYGKFRDYVLPWPSRVTAKGKLEPMPYSGGIGGWPIYFKNPDQPEAVVSALDLQRVADKLVELREFSYDKAEGKNKGTLELKLGDNRGTVQIWPKHMLSPEGNGRIATGTVEKAAAARQLLFQSMWFSDALGLGPLERCPADIVHAEGDNIILPPLVGPLASVSNVSKIVKKVIARKGDRIEETKKAMRQFVVACGFSKEAASTIVDQAHSPLYTEHAGESNVIDIDVERVKKKKKNY